MSKKAVKVPVEGFLLAALVPPFHILIHEVVGHWLIAKLLGAEQLSIGYTHVDTGTAKEWEMQKQLPVHIGGPLSTNLLCLLGLTLLGKQGTFAKMFGWALVIPTYRSLAALVRQLTYEKAVRDPAENEYLTDETLISQGLHISKFLVSVPNLLLSFWLLWRSYRYLPENKGIIVALSLAGNVVGTYLYIKKIGPKVLPQKFDYAKEVFRTTKGENQ